MSHKDSFSFRYIILFFLLVFIGIPLLGQIIPAGKVLNPNKIRQTEKLRLLSPGGNRFTPRERQSLWQSIIQDRSLQSTPLRNNSAWELVGPSGILSSQGFNFICSGRIRDVEILDDNHIRIASASGGLWDIQKGIDEKVIYKNISINDVTSSWSGTVASDPFNANTILLDTGEPGLRYGTGLWRTTNMGSSWIHIPLEDGMSAFDEMEFTAVRGKVWTCGSDGVYFSDDSGLTWKNKKRGNHPGMVVFPNQPDTILVSEYDRGIFRTYDGGKSWKLLSNGLPIDSFSRIELSNCKSQPNVIFALYTNIQGFTNGIYKSSNGGDSWTRCTVINDEGKKDLDYHWGQAGYNSFISVSPTNPDHVISGGGWYIYSDDGKNFYGPTEGQHADFHSGSWSHDGQTAWYANDGGIYSTTFDKNWKWNLEFNHLPITQFVSLSVSRTNPNVMIGGTQDNGLVYYNEKVKKWFYLLGDGGGVAIDPNDEEKIYGTIGLSEPPLTFNNVRKFGPSVAGWQDINVGLYPSEQWWRLIDMDHNNPPTLFTQTDNKLYYSNNDGSTWEYLGFQDLSMDAIGSMDVSQGEFPKIYICGPGLVDEQMMVLDFAIWEWTNITEGLPVQDDREGYSLPNVFASQNPKLENRVYAVMRGYGPQLKGKSIFRSDKAGLDWVNITGNLPDVPYIVVFEHPENENILIAGTDGFGVYITENGGQHWSLWDVGLSKGAVITDMDYQKINDSIYVVASTYGHSIMRRYISTSGSVNTNDVNRSTFVNHIKKASYVGTNIILELSENTPNNSLLKICNIEGKCIFQDDVTITGNSFMANVMGLPSGIYVCSLQKEQKLLGTAKVMVP